MAEIRHELRNCTMVYDITNHSLTVTTDDGDVALKIWSLPERPEEFDVLAIGNYIEIHNPRGVEFVARPDA